MSMIKCPECGKEISDTADKCPNCGFRIKKKKPAWLIAVAIICGIIAVLVLSSGIKDLFAAKKLSSETENSNQLLDKYYMGMSGYHVYVVRFNDDNTVEFVDSGLGRDEDKRQKAYGTYSVDKNALDIKLSAGDTLTCVIHDDGNEITIEGETFSIIDEKEVSRKTMECFD